MVETKNTTLKEAFNRFDIVGVLAEKNLEVKNYGDKVAITGELVIKTGENSFHKVRVFANQLTSKGEESKSYKAFETVMNEYKSIVDTGSEETADKVSAFGKISEGKPYKNQQGEVVVYTSNQVSFISRVTGSQTYEPKAKWQGEVFVQNYQLEMEKGADDDLVETGRKIMNVVVPTYGGKAFTMKLMLEGEGAEWFEENVKRNDTVKVYCDLINTTIKTVQGTTGGGFGKKEPQIFTKTINERLVVGADDAYPKFDEEEETNKAYNPALITQALVIREQAIEEAKNDTPTAPTSRTGFGARPSTPSPTPTVEDEDDMPF